MSEAGLKIGAMDHLRSAVLTDQALHAELGAFDDLESFVPVAHARAQALGIDVSEEDLRTMLHGSPIGLERFSDIPPTLDNPPPGWLPIQVSTQFGQICLDWAWFGDRPLTDPFYEGSLRRAIRRPLSRLLRFRTLLGNLPTVATHLPLRKPAGLIFHMSRCGSTLASRMLAADRGNVVISEAAPIDSVLQLDRMVQALDPGAHVLLLKLMAETLGQKRYPAHERSFLKLDSWHTMALPLFRAAFPDVPWVFMYRDPVEVMASQILARGMQTVAEYLSPEVYGLDAAADVADNEDYCARVLGKTCEAVLEPYRAGGGLLVNYREMPDALFTRILPHFGVTVGAEQRAQMTASTQFNAKSPGEYFQSDETHKKDAVTDKLRASVEAHMMPVYRELERLRGGG